MPGSELSAVEVLQSVIDNSAAEQSATEAMAGHWAQAHSVGQLSAEYRALARIEEASEEVECPQVVAALRARTELIRTHSRGHSNSLSREHTAFRQHPSLWATPEL